MAVAGEQGVEAGLLSGGEEVGSGVEGAPCPVQGVLSAAAVSVEFLLDPAPALVEGVTGEPHDVERVHDGGSVGQLFVGGGVEAGEPIHGHDLHAGPPRFGSGS